MENFSGRGSVLRCSEKTITGLEMGQPRGDAHNSVPAGGHQEHTETYLKLIKERFPVFQETEKIEHFFSISVNPCR